jgi:hypothetical protein
MPRILPSTYCLRCALPCMEGWRGASWCLATYLLWWITSSVRERARHERIFSPPRLSAVPIYMKLLPLGRGCLACLSRIRLLQAGRVERLVSSGKKIKHVPLTMPNWLALITSSPQAGLEPGPVLQDGDQVTRRPSAVSYADAQTTKTPSIIDACRLSPAHRIPNLVPNPFNLSAALPATVSGAASTTLVIFSSSNGPFSGFTCPYFLFLNPLS